MLTERNTPVTLPNRNPNGINPALLTLSEYHDLINDKNKSHPDSAYDMSLKQLNSYAPKATYPKLYRNIKIHNLPFEIRLQDDPDEWGIAIFQGDTKVGAVQDEWGTLLVVVAQEYRGFGLGPILVKLARTIEPDRPSGGFTVAGYRNLIKVYQKMVREALASGLYHRLVTQGQITMERVKAIIASARLEPQEIKPQRDLNTNDPKSWLLYASEHGDFVLYDRKLKDLLEEKDDYFAEQMIKGYAYVQLHDSREKWAMFRQFGGDAPNFKRFLINCAVQLSNSEDTPLFLEPAEIEFIDKRMVDRVEDAGVVRGFKSYKVIPTGEEFDYEPLAKLERMWRKTFDRYDEFRVTLLERAHSKFQYVPEEKPRRGVFS